IQCNESNSNRQLPRQALPSAERGMSVCKLRKGRCQRGLLQDCSASCWPHSHSLPKGDIISRSERILRDAQEWHCRCLVGIDPTRTTFT
ncbi:hypothetical protein PMAYCL1PPCAC_20224, partial [Pristionchus mayeri]